jgi:hypothetical protein
LLLVSSHIKLSFLGWLHGVLAKMSLKFRRLSIESFSWLSMRFEGIFLSNPSSTLTDRHQRLRIRTELQFQFHAEVIIQQPVFCIQPLTNISSLIRSGAAVPFTGHASPPTITMPRVKAITTGSVPSFLDVVLNFAESDTSSTLATQDTWLAQMKAKPQGKLVMYGDDTWLKLFPGFFERADGTTSFFVSVRFS